MSFVKKLVCGREKSADTGEKGDKKLAQEARYEERVTTSAERDTESHALGEGHGKRVIEKWGVDENSRTAFFREGAVGG